MGLGIAGETRLDCSLDQATNVTKARQTQLRTIDVTHTYRTTIIKPGYDFGTINVFEVGFEGFSHSGPDQISRHCISSALLALILQLQLSGDRRQSGIYVAHPRADLSFTACKL